MIRLSEPGSYTTGTNFTAARLIDDERRINLNSLHYAILKADVATLKNDVAK